MFITVDGSNKTGIPGALWDLMEPYSQVDHASGVAILAIVILVLSNVASNVPTGILITLLPLLLHYVFSAFSLIPFSHPLRQFKI